MSRGVLSWEELAGIQGLLPSLAGLERLVHPLSPDLVAFLFSRESRVPEAAVCLRDALEALYGVRYALHEYHAHRQYYRETVTPPNPMGATFFERFYLEDAALRLYNAGEDGANAILAMLDLTTRSLAPYRGQSLRARVGQHLAAERPNDPLGVAANTLYENDSWRKAMDYRNRVVHEQPPSVEGLGIVHHRGNHWRHDGNRWVLPVGGGDTPELTTEDIAHFTGDASNAFIRFATSVASEYSLLLDARGYRPTPSP